MDEALQTLVASLLKLVLKQPQFSAPAREAAAATHSAPEAATRHSAQAPVIRFVPQADIARIICGQPCGARGLIVQIDEEQFVEAALAQQFLR